MRDDRLSNDTMISFQGIRKSYGGLDALHTTDIAVRRGEFLSLLGPSGSGKSTILNIIAGAIQPSSGRLLIDGQDVLSKPSRERGLGMVFQNYALLPHLNVYDNIAFPLRIRGCSNAEIKQKVGVALERVGLMGFEKRKPREMSGGQQQRVGIARCIVYSPSIILMDEPLGALDKKLRDQLQGEIKKIHRDLGTTLVYVTHDQEEALNLSDRICLMNGGRVAQHGTPDELYFEPKSEFVADFVGESNLLECTVEAGDRVRIKSGSPLNVKPGCANDISIGTRTKVMIRPEKMSITEGARALSPGENGASGIVRQISFVGGMTRFELEVEGGTTLLVKDISSRLSERTAIGQPMHVRWAAADSIVLK